jgi:hypothetical protein
MRPLLPHSRQSLFSPSDAILLPAEHPVNLYLSRIAVRRIMVDLFDL